MKKNIMMMGSIALLSANVYAAAACRPLCESMCFSPCEMYFLQLEGGYSWNTLRGLDITIMDVGDVVVNGGDNDWAGRVGVGFGKKVCDPFYATGEIGWGYYGNSKESARLVGPVAGQPGTPNLDGSYIKSMQNGFDILAGILYNQPRYELFFKVGALVENWQPKLNVDLSIFNNGSVPNPNGNLSVSVNQTEVLPEIKLGGAYHVTRNFAITADWTHAFGSNTRITADINPNDFPGDALFNFNLKNPGLDVLMLGVQYRFA